MDGRGSGWWLAVLALAVQLGCSSSESGLTPKARRTPMKVASSTEGLVSVGSGAEKAVLLLIDAETQRAVDGADVTAIAEKGGYLVRVAKDQDAYHPEVVFARTGRVQTVAMRPITPDLRVRMSRAAATAEDQAFVAEVDLDGVAELARAEKRPIVMFLPAVEEAAPAQGRFFVYRAAVPDTLLALRTDNGLRPADGSIVEGKARVVSTAGPASAGVAARAPQVASAAVARRGEIRAAPQLAELSVTPVAGDVETHTFAWKVEDPEERVVGYDVGVDTTAPARRVPATVRAQMIQVKRGSHFACVRPVFDGSDADPQLQCVRFEAALAPAAPDVRVRVQTPVDQAAMPRAARRPFPVSVEVENVGDVDAPPFSLDVVVSRDGTLEGGLGETRTITLDGVKAHSKAVRQTDVSAARDGSLFVVAQAAGLAADAEANPEDNQGRFAFSADPAGNNRAPILSLGGTAGASAGQVTRRQPVSLQAVADDPEDGDLSTRIRWESSRDGVLGEGPSIKVQDLSPGVHRIRATIVDSGRGRPAAQAPRGGRGSAILTQAQTVEDPQTVAAEFPIEVIEPEAPINSPPIARAGPDVTTTVGASVTPVSASASDPDGQPITIAWTLTRPAGSVAELAGASTLTPSFTADVAGKFVLTLKVSDGRADAIDTVEITASRENRSPAVSLSLPQTGNVGAALVAAISASDPDGDAVSLSFALAKPPGSTALVDGTASRAPAFTPDVAGTYTLSVVASDGRGGTARASAMTVVAGPSLPDAGAPPDAGPDAGGDAPVDAPDAPMTVDAPVNPMDKLPAGMACASAAQCMSSFCVDGVCCQSACTGACQSCNLAGRAGACAPVPAGDDPGNDCQSDDPSTCGKDGTCNGQGACRLYTVGSTCGAGRCEGGVESAARTCDGLGTCRAANTRSCAPYACGGTGCKNTCTSASDCAAGSFCEDGRCTGLQPTGAACSTASQCASGFCVDGVCCQSACGGACEACNVGGAAGLCTPVPAGQDPGNECAADPASTCGKDGTCDGRGACRLHGTDTVCAPRSCEAGAETAPATCDGLGRCQDGAKKSCAPFACAADACFTACGFDGDCQAGSYCDAGVCRAKLALGTVCSGTNQCASGFCVDGVCCQSSCGGTCYACNVTGAVGTCVPVPAGKDPRDACSAEAPSTCGRDGSCDGRGACRLHSAGTTCAGGSCDGDIETGGRVCDGAGTCKHATSRSCAPFLCGAAGECRSTCASDAECTSPNVCVNGSCGLKPTGTVCAVGAECASGQCSQGVCCDIACNGTCKSCALPGSVGTCTAVPSGQDPMDHCTDAGASSCAADGFCNGAGACRLYAAGVTCSAQTCTDGVQTGAGTCNGSGACTAGVTQACGGFLCSGNACGGSCSTDDECAATHYCAEGTCVWKKANGVACTMSTECSSTHCEQGVCCETGCPGTCMSCALAGKVGKCSAVPAGQDPQNHCADAGVSSCGTDGTCNGTGACRLYIAGTSCSAATCAGSAQTSGGTCNGAGICVAGDTTSCSPYLCGGTACKTTCSSNNDCAAPYTCQGNVCALKPQGAACASGTECANGICQQGVCCNSACGGCKSCVQPGMVGTCSPVIAGTDPFEACPTDSPSTCGKSGMCDGAGGCAYYGAGTTCGTPSCTGGVANPAATCNGSGSCVGGTTQTCSPYSCGPMYCYASCVSDSNCASGYYCNGSACVAKRATGNTCVLDSECQSNVCAQGICCSTACADGCSSCANAGSLGTCTPVAAGTDPKNACADSGATTCGHDGTCDGTGACRFYSVGTICAAASCSGSTKANAWTCNGAGTCSMGGTTSCSPYACGANGECATTCTSPSQCASPNTCDPGKMKCGLPYGYSCMTNSDCASQVCGTAAYDGGAGGSGGTWGTCQ